MVLRRGLSLELRRIAVAVAGFCVLSLGLALLVVPVPGTSIVVIPLGLAILGKEFAWANRLLAWATGAIRRGWARVCGACGFQMPTLVVEPTALS